MFRSEKGSSLSCLVPHNNTRFKVASDLSKSVLGSLTLKQKIYHFLYLIVSGPKLNQGKRLRVWPVPVAGKHVGGRGTRSGIFPKCLHKMCEGEGLGSRGYHSFQSLDFAAAF